MHTALITGASSGLGLQLAYLFAADGHGLILVSRRREALDSLAVDLRDRHPQIQVDVIDMDLSTAGAGQRLFDKVNTLGLRVDFLVNNAGFGTTGSFAELALTHEMQMMDLNMRSLVELTHLFLPTMLKHRFGRVLNVGSTAGFQPGPFMATYYASKAFVNSFSEALHEELSGTGVSCTVLAPGATATEFAQSAEATDTWLFRFGLVASAEDVARKGYIGMKNGRALIVPGLMNQIMVQSLRFSPRWIVRKLASRANRQ